MFTSLSSGVRQDHNKIARGYYRTDDETTERICHLLRPKNQDENMVIFDPCSGEGIALLSVKEHLGEHCTTYGIELDGERYVSSYNKLDKVLHGDSNYLVAGAAWAGLMWFNPPYGTAKNSNDKPFRLERQFWGHHASRVIPGGVLVAILPDFLFYREDAQMADFFSRYLEPGTWSVYRAAEDQFKQIVIIGYRRHKAENTVSEPDVKLRDLLLNQQDDLPELPNTAVDHPYLVPASKEPEIFRMNSVTKETVAMVLPKDKGFMREVEMVLQAEHCNHQRFSSVAPVREGHIPVLMAAGGLDGFVQDDSGHYLVRGTVRTVLHVDTKESLEAKKQAKEKARQKPEIRVDMGKNLGGYPVQSTVSDKPSQITTITTRKHETHIMAWDISNDFDLITIE
ncbi:Plasmid-related protein [Acidithiobacillus ferrivorans]|uniref:Plasmid-related protein n=1 Tax=Acidithiobacillus ferrivorans TaxID=160808 RepID=A0A060UL57_9PROT|nr:DUF6094 domain-containing protein [Acidithiobacillus ferrivorans]CDQ09220.1 Plasmid-related protein [Acidithiobacillus ferrivorans]SMH64888.1 Plasmid-related protein [Acidithiobacillus ferrivorans]